MITGVRFALVCEGHCVSRVFCIVSRVNHSDSRVNLSASRVFHFISRVNRSAPRVFHFVPRVNLSIPRVFHSAPQVSLFALIKNLFAYAEQRGFVVSLLVIRLLFFLSV